MWVQNKSIRRCLMINSGKIEQIEIYEKTHLLDNCSSAYFDFWMCTLGVAYHV